MAAPLPLTVRPEGDADQLQWVATSDQQHRQFFCDVWHYGPSACP